MAVLGQSDEAVSDPDGITREGMFVAAVGDRQRDKFASYSQEYMAYEAETVALSRDQPLYVANRGVCPSGACTPGLRDPLVILETPEHEHPAYAESQAGGVLNADAQRANIAMCRRDMIAGLEER
ncbi:hypothetical protein [Streptomyces sp. MAR4 CNX-425]|uniref:hypothetical protein n=1 Tax=Streptomyces sp. MAR4 CNX-425 TaxID=3406343 RepID=UPI003B507C3C